MLSLPINCVLMQTDMRLVYSSAGNAPTHLGIYNVHSSGFHIEAYSHRELETFPPSPQQEFLPPSPQQEFLPPPPPPSKSFSPPPPPARVSPLPPKEFRKV